MINKLLRYKLNIYIMYGYYFFHNLIFAYVIERIFWASRGITNQEVVYTEIIYASIVILLEIPTGSLADVWSRKIMMIINAALSFGEFIILIYAHSFWHFALAVSLAGIGKSLSSGTSNALIYDSLKLLNREDSFEKVMGRMNFFDYFAIMFAGLIGSYIAQTKGTLTTYWLSLISVSISVILMFFLYEPIEAKEAEKHESYLKCIKEAFIFLRYKPNIRFVLLFGIVIGAVVTYIDEFWQIYLSAIHIPILFFGLVSVARSITSSISGIYAYRIKNNFTYNQVFGTLIVVIAFSTIATSFMSSYLGLIPLIAIFLAFGLVEPLTMGFLHHRTESNIRATVESFQSLVLRGFTIVAGLIFGYFSTHLSIFIGFRALGIILALYSIYYFWGKTRRGLI